MPAQPIWRDLNVSLVTNPGILFPYGDYEIRRNNEAGALLFSGRAYMRPGALSLTTRINDICAPYLRQQLPALVPAGFVSFENAATFAVCQTGYPAKIYTLYADWSYDEDFDPDTMPLAAPIRAELDPRQPLIFSVLPGENSIDAVLTFADGTTAVVTIAIVRSADFSDDFNDDFATEEENGGGGAAILDLSPFSGLVSVEIGGVLYRIRQDLCAELAVYYVNAYGGWDSLLIHGNVVRRDELERHTTMLDYDNNDSRARGRKDYAIEVKPGWTINTDILTDDESSRMHHLLNSTDVYLFDLATRRFTPVVLTDTQHARQSYKSNGHQVCRYQFNALLAQEQFRR